ncbi:unnamed protein product [Acanthoscelides obtectus]|uniref:Uncharacterized protein n=1 Tax=Acanthoscelides obtectus TaxID=200917 RepID=A0A9P0P823_ACAOB|nr:unnamed protein product [Acanthoscelides obtectus]CAK1620621.1 hypothetical protein AOBTE_LOCUS474 [Acanthoscelides obtectus]
MPDSFSNNRYLKFFDYSSRF